MNKQMLDCKTLGQYFTPDKIAREMVHMIGKPKSASILEPSAGKGVFLRALTESGYHNLTAIEIDPTLPNESEHDIECSDFLRWKAPHTYDVIIGNPPYVRWKNISPVVRDELRRLNFCNGLMDILHAFILKSLRVLGDGGEMIFITPDYWLKTHHATRLREELLKYGSIESMKLFGEKRVFEGVASSIMIFKFVKSKITRRIKITDMKNNIQFKHDQFDNATGWDIIPPNNRKHLYSIEQACDGSTLGDIVEIGNGMVSGKDRAFRLEAGTSLSAEEYKKTIKVIKAHSLEKYVHNGHTDYILLTNMDNVRAFPNFYKQLKAFKLDLENRYDYNKGTKWYEWSFMRNYDMMRRSRDKILVPCKERINKKQFVRFAYASGDYYATQDVTMMVKNPKVRESIKYILGVLNSDIIFTWLSSKGMLRGGVLEFSEKPLMRIPIKRIDWENHTHVSIHDEIVRCVEDIISRRKDESDRINDLVTELYAV